MGVTMRLAIAHDVSLGILKRVLVAVLVVVTMARAGETLFAEEYRYQWSEISSEELVGHFRDLVRISDVDGKVHVGMLVDLLGRKARLQRARSDGGEVMQIDLDSVSSVEVLERILR